MNVFSITPAECVPLPPSNPCSCTTRYLHLSRYLVIRALLLLAALGLLPSHRPVCLQSANPPICPPLLLSGRERGLTATREPGTGPGTTGTNPGQRSVEDELHHLKPSHLALASAICICTSCASRHQLSHPLLLLPPPSIYTHTHSSSPLGLHQPRPLLALVIDNCSLPPAVFDGLVAIASPPPCPAASWEAVASWAAARASPLLRLPQSRAIDALRVPLLPPKAPCLSTRLPPRPQSRVPCPTSPRISHQTSALAGLRVLPPPARSWSARYARRRWSVDTLSRPSMLC